MNYSRPVLEAKPGDLMAYWEELQKRKKDDIQLRINASRSLVISEKAWNFLEHGHSTRSSDALVANPSAEDSNQRTIT